MTTISSRTLTVTAIAALSLGITGCNAVGPDAVGMGKKTVTKAADGQQQTQTTKPEPTQQKPTKQEPPKASEVWNKAQDRLESYTSLKMTLIGTSGGKEIQADCSGDTAGTMQRMEARQGDAKATMLTVDDTNYVKNNKKALERHSRSQDSAEAALLKKTADKWLNTGPASKNKFFIKNMQDDLTNDRGSDSKKLSADTAKVTSDTLDGKNAWKITSDDADVIAWVSADGKYDLLKLSGSDYESSPSSPQDKIAEITFSDYNKNFDIKKPANAIRLEDLRGKI